MTEQLRQALAHIDEIPAPMQDELAAQIEDLLAPFTERASYFGVMPDLPDDAEEELLRLRREAPPIEEQLQWLAVEDE
jgi:hypothetical protein